MQGIHPISIMIADESLVMRNLLKNAIETEPYFKLVASVSNGHQAITEVRKNPKIQVALLDLQLPIVDGLHAIPRLLEEQPKLKIIIVSSLAASEEQKTMEALAAGAADYIAKPNNKDNIEKFFKELFFKVNALLITQNQSTLVELHHQDHGEITLKKAPELFCPEIIAIASSTGGPKALIELFKGFSESFLSNRYIFITQHIKKDFVEPLVSMINSIGKIKCKKATDKEQIKKGIIYLAPTDTHLKIYKEENGLFIHLSDSEPENFCRPSADPMFRSLTKISHNILAIVLTGIGADGLKGSIEIIENDGVVIAQDEETSIVWGMPGAVAKAGICSAILPLNKIATYIEKSFL